MVKETETGSITRAIEPDGLKSGELQREAADYIALANLCQAHSTRIDAQRQMKKTGILYKSKSGYVQQDPLLGIIHTQTTIVNNLLREFGLTPSSRTRVATVQPEKKPNRFAALAEAYGACPAEDPQIN